MLQCYMIHVTTHHNEPVLRPLSHVVAALGPSQLALVLGPAGLAVVCHLVTISSTASPPSDENISVINICLSGVETI